MNAEQFAIWHYLSKKAEKEGCIDDLILPAMIKVHFDLSSDEALSFYKEWKKCYIKALLDREAEK